MENKDLTEARVMEELKSKGYHVEIDDEGEEITVKKSGGKLAIFEILRGRLVTVDSYRTASKDSIALEDEIMSALFG